MNWAKNPAMVEALLVLARGGATAVEIGDQLGCSKNAIIGACRRHGIDLLWKPSGRKPRARPRRYRTRKKAPHMPSPNGLPPQKPAPPAAPAPPQPCTILELDNRSCRWVLTDAAPWTYCGSPEADLTGGTPYCREHAKVAYGRRAGA